MLLEIQKYESVFLSTVAEEVPQGEDITSVIDDRGETWVTKS